MLLLPGCFAFPKNVWSSPGDVAGAGIAAPVPSTNLSLEPPFPPQLLGCRGLWCPDKGKIHYALCSQWGQASALRLNWELLAVINEQGWLCVLWGLGVGAQEQAQLLCSPPWWGMPGIGHCSPLSPFHSLSSRSSFSCLHLQVCLGIPGRVWAVSGCSGHTWVTCRGLGWSSSQGKMGLMTLELLGQAPLSASSLDVPNSWAQCHYFLSGGFLLAGKVLLGSSYHFWRCFPRGNSLDGLRPVACSSDLNCDIFGF